MSKAVRQVTRTAIELFDCPSCAAVAGERCIRKSGIRYNMSYVHDPRWWLASGVEKEDADKAARQSENP